MSTVIDILAIVAIAIDLLAIFYIVVLDKIAEGIIIMALGILSSLAFGSCDTILKAVVFVVVNCVYLYVAFTIFKLVDEKYPKYGPEQKVSDDTVRDR